MFGGNFRKTLESFWIDWRVTLKKKFGEILGHSKEHPMNFPNKFLIKFKEIPGEL